MKKQKQKLNGKLYCLGLACVFIFTGCVSSGKKDQIVKIQKVRIKQLEKQLQSKNKTIEKLKVQKWVNKPVQMSSKVALQPLKKLIKQKRWVEALKMSYQLKNKYPRSRRLAYYRIKILKKMGLSKQAAREAQHLRKLRSKNRTKGARQL